MLDPESIARPRLFRHPRIHTGVPGAPPATGLLIAGEQIVAVGEAGALAADAVEIVDLDGAAVIPGLHDAHIHSGDLALDASGVDLRGTATLEEALGRIADFAGANPTGWVLGGHWDSNRWTPAEQPDRRALDGVCPARPVLLWTVDAHTAWANSEALRRAGISSGTADPDGGEIVRDQDGEPTGILRETAAGLVSEVLNRENPADLTALIAAGQQRLLSVGLTAITDIDGEDVYAAYRTLQANGALQLRVHKAVRAPDLDFALAAGRRTNDGDAWLGTGPVKIFADGALGSHTCHMTSEFAGDPGNRGMAVTEVQQIAELTSRALRGGLSVATHAIGDRANQLVLDAYQPFIAALPAGLRLRIEHAQYLRPADVRRMAEWGVVASMQPTHCLTDFALVDRILVGHDILSYPWRSLLDAGAPLAFGSDAPVEDPNPFPGLAAAIDRAGWQPEQRISPAEALAAYSHGAAFAAGWQDRVGQLQPGMLADFVAVDVDPLDAPADELAGATALTTVVGGKIGWQHN